MRSQLLLLLSLLLLSASPVTAGDRQVWSWGSYSYQLNETIAQLRNETWSQIIDGVQLWCGCRWSETGVVLHQDEFQICKPMFQAALDSDTKVQFVIHGKTVPSAALSDPQPFIDDAIRIYHNLNGSISGFSLDDERDCAPRGTLEEFGVWMQFHNAFAEGLAEHGIELTSAVQAIFGIQDEPDNEPCKYEPSHYPYEPRVLQWMQSATFLQRWLVMDTYYYTTGRFMGLLDWYVDNIPLNKLAIGMKNRTEFSEDELVARFHALHRANIEWINIWMTPIDDKFLPYLQRWKNNCRGCGAQSLLGCFDTDIECSYDDADFAMEL